MPSALVPSVGTDWRLEKERRPLVVHGFLGTGAAWESGRYLFRWSRRKRKVSSLGAGGNLVNLTGLRIIIETTSLYACL